MEATPWASRGAATRTRAVLRVVRPPGDGGDASVWLAPRGADLPRRAARRLGRCATRTPVHRQHAWAIAGRGGFHPLLVRRPDRGNRQPLLRRPRRARAADD